MNKNNLHILKSYYYLTKPGIIYSNVFIAIGGFFLAAKGQFTIILFLAMTFGLGLVIASACVFNNYIDRDIDTKMSRTKKRALVTKEIPANHALVYATILGFIGFFLLLFYTNLLAAFIAFVGFFFYVVVYSMWWKRKSEFGTIVGSISGAVPPVVGYCAVTNHFDIAALLLFAVLVFWQMPHFYAIALFRSEDYANASIPVLPLKKGVQQTKLHMVFYIIAFMIAVILLTILHYTGYIYLVAFLVLGGVWLATGIKGFSIQDEKRWARKMFFLSLIALVTFSVLLSFNKVLF